jgi:flagellar hook-associated protein 1
MGSTLGSYDIARSGLFVSERSLYVTGHNIANVNTTGYTRQQAMLAATVYPTQDQTITQIGHGAEVEETRQIRHTFLDNIYRNENMTLGYWEMRNKSVQDVQAILGEPMGAGLQGVLNKFWDSWQELSKDPSSISIRATVRQRGQDLANQVNHLGSQLDALQNNLNLQIFDSINEINDITRQIASLNQEIFKDEVNGDRANDYRDQRNVLVDRLTKLADVDVNQMYDGRLSVTLGGYFLVDKGESTEIYPDTNPSTGPFIVPKFCDNNMDVPLKNGVLKGLIDARGNGWLVSSTSGNSAITNGNVSVSDLKQMLNDLVTNIVKQVNEVHISGKTLSGNQGGNFFAPIQSAPQIAETYPVKPTHGTWLGNLKLDDNITDLANIVTSKGTSVGDNTLALQIANLRNDDNIMQDGLGGDLSIDRFYQSIIRSVGNSGSEARNILENQQKLVQSTDDKRQAISGVSMDEEMSNMMKFQYAYGASSRVINVIDQMVETMITKMGLVGR